MEPYKGYATDVWFNLGKQFIAKSKADDQPFFLYLPLNAPHVPWLAPEEDRAPYLQASLDREAINFYAMINGVDKGVGDLVSYLKKEGLWEDTIFIFTSDNGSALWGDYYNAGFRGKKGTLYEGGHRVPFFISWPNGRLVAPGDIDELTQCQDLLPTLKTLCDLPANASQTVDGMDFSRLLTGQTNNDFEERVAVVQFSATKYEAAVMYQDWRWVFGKELYYLKNDKAQKTNIADQYPAVVQKLKSYYDNWWERIALSEEPQPYVINEEEAVKLTAYDWYGGDRVYNWPHLRAGDRSNGKYLLEVATPGTYAVSLRRWPRESGAGIRDSVPAFMPFDSFLGELPKGKAFEILKAKVRLGDTRKEMEVKPDDQEVTFLFDIPVGRTHLHTWFVDQDGIKFGSFYVYIEYVKEE